MIAAAEPFALGEGPDACLLLHGLTGGPAEVRPLGEALARAGIRSVAPLLPGHGTRPEELGNVTRAALLAAAAEALSGLRGARRIFIAGLSAGALLTLRLAERAGRDGTPPLAAIALLAPAVRFAGTSWLFAELLGRLPPLPGALIDKGRRDVSVSLPESSGAVLPPQVRDDGSYSAVPLSWARELRLLAAEALAAAPRVRAPALLVHGGLDRTATPAGSLLLAARLGSTSLQLRSFPASGHLLPLDRDGVEVARAVVSFFQGA